MRSRARAWSPARDDRLDPFAHRDPARRRLISGMAAVVGGGRVARSVHPAHRGRDRRRGAGAARSAGAARTSRSSCTTSASRSSSTAAGRRFRLGADWEARPGERFTGLGARHGEQLDQTGRRVRLGADRRYTGPDCPPDMLDVGGIPQGDYAPVPCLIASRGYALWLETERRRRGVRPGPPHLGLHPRRRRAVSPARAHRPHAGRPPAPLPAPQRQPARSAARVGLRALEVARRVRAPARRGGRLRRLRAQPHRARRDRDRLALGDAVQHLGAQPAPVRRLRGDGRAASARRGAHGGLGHPLGQPRVGRRPAPARPGVGAPAPRAGAELRAGGARGATS